MIGRVGRVGRPGLLGTVARTAVIAGTATAVSGGMQRRQAARSAQQQQADMAREQEMVNRAAAQAQPVPDRMQQLRELGEMQAGGLLTPEEFAAEKSRILAS
jgi:ATPase subunit of ABC transporter with duplicated ATPase domains